MTELGIDEDDAEADEERAAGVAAAGVAERERDRAAGEPFGRCVVREDFFVRTTREADCGVTVRDVAVLAMLWDDVECGE